MMEDQKPERPESARMPARQGSRLQAIATVLPKREPVFRRPEVIAEEEDRQATRNTAKTKKRWSLRNLTMRQWFIIVAGLAIAAASSSAVWALTHRLPPPDNTKLNVPAYVKPEPPKTTEPSRLTGVEIPIEQNKLPVTGIMIENSPDARPQSGLKDAGVVIEAIAEGGITRFLTLFQEAQPDYVGPVRSVRPYYLDFLVPFDAAIAHAGGSGLALAQIRNEGIKDLDHGANGGAFTRVDNRYAPHNLYTSLAQMLELQKNKGFSSTFTGFTRKKEAPSQTPNAKAVDLNISSYLYNARFDYDAASNSYKRSEGGRPHTDERSGQQISPKVVIALVMSHHYDGIYSVYGTTGSGKAYVFQDGLITEGTWEKADRKTQISFKAADGSVLALNPGQTWLTLVSPGAVQVTP